MIKHKSGYKSWTNGKSRKATVYNICHKYGYLNFAIVLLQVRSCDSRIQLLAFESHFIRTLNCVNKVVPDRTIEEYKQDNKKND
jgi:hypothetical protein